jgi:hypothetical protein
VAANGGRFYAPQSAPESHAERNTALQLRVLYSADIGEVMGATEDLWLRMVVVHDAMTGDDLLLVRSLTEVMDAEGCQLLEAMQDGMRYQWSQNGTTGSLVSAIRPIGNTVVVELTPTKQLRRWPDGEAAQWALQSHVHRIQAQGGGV